MRPDCCMCVNLIIYSLIASARLQSFSFLFNAISTWCSFLRPENTHKKHVTWKFQATQRPTFLRSLVRLQLFHSPAFCDCDNIKKEIYVNWINLRKFFVSESLPFFLASLFSKRPQSQLESPPRPSLSVKKYFVFDRNEFQSSEWNLSSKFINCWESCVNFRRNLHLERRMFLIDAGTAQL